MFDFIDYNIFQVFSSNGEVLITIFVSIHVLHQQITTVKQTNKIFTKEMDLIMQVTKKLLIKNRILKHENAGL